MDYRNNDIDRMNLLSPLVWAYAGDAYYEYNGQDSQGNIIRGNFLGHGGQSIN